MKEVFELMQYFPGSVITSAGEVILDKKGNVSFSVYTGMTRDDILCKIFEWCSRSCAKAEPYSNMTRNSEWRDSLILKFNKYIGVTFNQFDYYWIYDRLGNGINHERTLRFIADGYDMKKLSEYK